MITRIIALILKSVAYIKNHPQVLFVLTLLILLPVLFLYTGQQFLEVGRSNQDRLQKDKIGVMHDSFAALLFATNFDIQKTDVELSKMLSENHDIVDYSVAKQEQGKVIILASVQKELVGTEVDNTELYSTASLRTSESIIFESYDNNVRYWFAYRSIRSEDGELYFLYTKTSLYEIDTLFTSREQKAYFSLFYVYCFVIALAYWHIRLTDYRFLYIQAQKANQMKDLFTNMIAHELRAPLTAVRGYADLLESTIDIPEQKVQAIRIKESAERMLAILTDLLDVARIHSGKLSIKTTTVNVTGVIQKVFSELKVTAAEKQIALICENGAAFHTAQVDPQRLQQVFTNIVNNSIKYTKQGSIAISVVDMHAFVEVRVKDTGMGIASEDQKKLFAPFFRVASTDMSNITGTGLGMWITKELIELMHGSIGVESIKGVGTHVVVKLPKHIRTM